MLNTFFLVYLLCAGIIGMLAASILIFININKEVTRYLGIHLFVVSFHALSIVAIYNNTILQIPHIYYLDHALLMINGPVLYFYLREVLTKQKYSFKLDVWHFLPAVALFIYHVPFYIKSANEKHEIIKSVLGESTMINKDILHQDFFFVFIAFSVVIYSIMNFQLYFKFNKQTESSKTELAYFFKWVRLFMIFGFTNVILFLIITINVESGFVTNKLMQLVLGFHILIISITLFTNPHLLYGIIKPISLKEAFEIKTGKMRPLFNCLQKDAYLNTLVNYLSSNPFLKTDFTLKTMSEETSIPLHHLSFLINDHYKVNFNDFINRHRIEYVIRKDKESKWNNYSIEGIANEIGFKSKSTFINSFRKLTGTTPYNYLFNKQK